MAGRRIFLSFVLCVLMGHAYSGRIRRVVGGQPVSMGTWPWLVSLHFQEDHPYLRLQGLDHLCAGALIDPYWVLTAAHCVHPLLYRGLDNPSNWIAVLGDYHRRVEEATEQALAILQIYVTPKFAWNPAFTGDIALLKLATPATPSPQVRPIPIDDGMFIPDGAQCDVAGWGQHTEAESTVSPQFGNGTMVPHVVTLKKENEQNCRDQYNSTSFSIDDSVLCFTSDEQKDTCQGDSGGPLVCQNPLGISVLSGIVSAGAGCGRQTSSGIYTRVSKYAAWIRRTVAMSRSRSPSLIKRGFFT